MPRYILRAFVTGIVAIAIVPSDSIAADIVPNFNITANCKAELAGGSSIGETLDSCINDERQAKDQLTQAWGTYSTTDKNACIKETSMDGKPSYVELQTCLEMAIESNARHGSKK